MFGAIFESARNAATAAGKAAAEALSSGVEKVGAAADAAKEAAANTTSSVKNWASDRADQVKQKASDIVDAAEQKAAAAKDWAMEKAAEAKNLAIKEANEAKQRAQELKDAAFKKAGEAKGWTLAKARNVRDAAIDTGLAAARPIADAGGRGVISISDLVKPYLGRRPVEQSILPCVSCDQSMIPDSEKDGKFMVPREDGGCDVVNAPPSFPPPAKGGAERTITYVNGILTSGNDHCATLHEIKSMTGANVLGVYNSTAGFMKDGAQTFGDRALVDAAANGRKALANDGRNPAVDTMSDYLISQLNAGTPPEVWAHSQGGAITSLALFDARNRMVAGGADASQALAGVKVTSMGAAAPQWPPGPSYTHYVHIDDPVPTALGVGREQVSAAARSGVDANGKAAEIVMFSGEPGGPYDTENPAKGIPGLNHHSVVSSYLPAMEPTAPALGI